MVQPDEAAAPLSVLLLHTRRLIDAHTMLVEHAAQRGALSLTELEEHGAAPGRDARRGGGAEEVVEGK